MSTSQDCFSEQPSNNLLKVISIPIWVFISFVIASLFVSLIMALLKWVDSPIIKLNETVLNVIASSFLYIITLFIVIAIPNFIAKKNKVFNDLGLGRLLSWSDIFFAIVSFFIYLIISASLTFLASEFLPWFDAGQIQQTGFNHISQRFEYILAFFALVVIAPIAEEILFRGYMYGRLKKYSPTILAALVTSVLFGAFHGTWNVAIDTFALSLVLCGLRSLTGSVWSSIILHIIKNSLAFFFLFIYPLISATIK